MSGTSPSRRATPWGGPSAVWFVIRAGAAALALVIALAPATARGQDEVDLAEARRLYNEATAAFNEERFRDAALNFEAASRLKPHAVALYTAAQAWEAAGELARAADAYSFALATPKLSESQAERARTRLEEIEATIGTAVIVGTEGTRVQLDDHSEVTVPARLHGKPGEHTLLILRGDGSVDRRTVTLAEGESTEVDADERGEQPTGDEPAVIDMAEPKKKPVRVDADSSGAPGSLWKTVGFVTAGAGVAALGGATLLGLAAKDAEDTYRSAPSHETLDHARGLQTKTNVMLIVGGVLTAGGVGLVVWQSLDEKKEKSAARFRVTPGVVWAEGRF